MEGNFYSQMKKLINSVDLTKINYKLIKTNIKKLIKVYSELKKIWYEIDNNLFQYNIYDIKNNKYNEIINILNQNFLYNNLNIKKIIFETKYIHCLSYSNIYFYWLENKGEKNLYDKNYLLGLNMFKISLSLNLYKYNKNDDILRYIIWIPINKKRDFTYNKINKINLKKSQENFEAFVASGVTFDLNPKITIITRYEEVEKLLIHELIHNYNIDGSEFHNQLEKTLLLYNNVKNKGNYHYDYSIYESYTEMLSTYFYLLFINIKLDLQINSDELENKLIGQILLELLYSYNLICNLIKLNDYSTYEEFRTKIAFDGEICKYEYYYIKGLMYNNFELKFGNDLKDFINIYNRIIVMIEKIKINDDIFIKEIYINCIKQTNYKYQIH